MPSSRRSTGAPLPASARRFAFLVVLAAGGVTAALLPGAWRALRDEAVAWTCLAYVAGLVVGERLMVGVPIRQERFCFGLTDGVIVAGLVLLPEALLIPATGLGVGAAQLLVAGRPWVKRLFNAAQHLLGVGAAALVYATLTAGSAPPLAGRLTWGALAAVGAASAAYFLVTCVLVAVAVSCSSGQGLHASLRRVAPVALVVWGANTGYGLVAVVLLALAKPLLPLLAVPLVLSVVGNRAWARSVASGQRLHALYEAGRSLLRHLGEDGAWADFTEQVAGVLDCEGAALFLARPDGRALDVVATHPSPDHLVAGESPASWQREVERFAAEAGWERPLLEPVEAEGRTLGFLLAHGGGERLAEDRETLRTLANHAAAALVNRELYRRAEDERATLRDIVAHSSDGIYTVGPDRTVRSWNPAMAALTGYGEEEAVGQKCFHLLRARDAQGVDMCAHDCPILAAARSGKEEVREVSVLSREGVARWIRYAHAPIMRPDGGMQADVVVVRDVTREREADELKSDFVASVSHELRTPLTPIKGFLLTLLREDLEFPPEKRREYYGLMLAQAQRLERLIEDLLDVSHLEAESGRIETGPIDARQLVWQVVERFSQQEPNRSLRATVPGRPVYARGDWLRVDQVLGNLVSNALRYSPPHEPVEVRLAARDREVIFEVHDRGPGIPAEYQDRIFERFHRGGHHLTRAAGGAGLGLYLAKRLVEAMGGRIWLTSRLGEGSVFCFALPATRKLSALPEPGPGSRRDTV